MQRVWRWWAWLAGALLGLAACAEPPQRAHPQSPLAVICSHFRAMDRRHDGRVDFGEYSDYLDARGLQDFNPYFGVIDRNRDGYITAGECAHAVAEERSLRRVRQAAP